MLVDNCYLLDYNALKQLQQILVFRGGPRAAATYKMESFMIIINGFKPLTIITKCSILDVAAALDSPLSMIST